MYIDFHTHGKLAKYLPFSVEYTDWMLKEAKASGLDAICLTEHFNTLQFDELYGYIEAMGTPQGDAYVIDGLKVFPGMEIDIAEGGHVLCIGFMDDIRELNRRLEPYKVKNSFLRAGELLRLLEEYPVLIGAGHPFREKGHIPELPKELLERFDFIDLNGKDIAMDGKGTKSLTYELSKELKKPVVGGSDTHQAVQYGCIRTCFEWEFDTLSEMYGEMKSGCYFVSIHPEAELKVKAASVLKRALKEIHALGGDYVSVLLDGGEMGNMD